MTALISPILADPGRSALCHPGHARGRGLGDRPDGDRLAYGGLPRMAGLGLLGVYAVYAVYLAFMA